MQRWMSASRLSIFFFRGCVASMALCGAIQAAWGQAPQTIGNKMLNVTVSPDGAFTLESRGRNVITEGKLSVTGGAVTKQATNDPLLGMGQQILISTADGREESDVRVFEGLPFALVRRTLANIDANPVVLNRVPVASFDVALGKPAAALRTMGTGGLLPVDRCAGSYVWMTVVEPQSRNGIVAAWLTNERASGVLIPAVKGDGVRVEARGDYGHLRILPGKSVQTETLAIGYFNDARLGLEQWAAAVAKVAQIKLKPQPTGFCTWYAEKHGGAADEKSIAKMADFTSKNLKPYGFSFLQIDDQWQLGEPLNGSPMKNFSAANPKGPYASGMKATADRIKAAGLTPGIWFMPFSGTAGDPWFADKTDLFVHFADGKPYDCSWGGVPLDMTNPKARDYLKSIVGRISHEWGFGYFKMDGLWTGLAARQNYVNDVYKEDNFGDAVFFDPDKTNVDAFRDGMKLVRTTAGADVFFLGCNMAQNMRMFGASFGLFDAMRVGPDNGGDWQSWSASPHAGSREYFLNGRIWYNDPDPQYLRASIPLAEARTIAAWTAVSGGLNTVSDWLPDLPAERVALLRQTMPSHGKVARPVDYFENDPPRIWLVADDSGSSPHWVIGLFNWSDQEQSFDIPLERFGMPAAGHFTGFDFWADKFISDISGSIKVSIPKHGCAVLSLRAAENHPQVISTSRHICQGMVDLKDEKWNGSALSGKSEVIAGDDYELRLTAPAQKGDYAVKLSDDDKAAGVKARLTGVDGGARVTLQSPVTRRVSWSIESAPSGQP